MSPLRIVPLGGLGEIGMNCLAIEADAGILVVDCGVTFPRSDIGIDTFHPDLSWLERRAEHVRGLVITHGHEDHIGAIPYFADRFDVPIWGPAYSIELVRLRLGEHGVRANEVDLRVANVRRPFDVRGFEVEPIRVTHSTADSTALAIRTPEGTIVHTGDFKLDPDPAGELTDEARLRELGDEGVRLLLSDSTNVDLPGSSPSESVARDVLATLIEGFPNRIVVGCFASNIPRLSAIGEIAQRTKRKLTFLGRSVQTHVRVAEAQQFLRWPSDLVVTPDDAMKLPRGEVLCVASGTQAERPAALYRLAHRDHPYFQLDPGDRVILSSRAIPGNEPAVVLLVNAFLRHGIDVRTPASDPGVHVSGHAHRDEQTKMIDLVRPRGFVPIHGTLHHLHRHARLARERGVAEVVVLENGEIASLDRVAPLVKLDERAPFAKIPTFGGEEIPERVLFEREAIARSGVAFVAVHVDDRGRSLSCPAIAARGVLAEEDAGPILRDAAREVVKALDARPWQAERPTDEEIAELARLTTRKRLEHAVGKKPVVVAHVIRDRS